MRNSIEKNKVSSSLEDFIVKSLPLDPVSTFYRRVTMVGKNPVLYVGTSLHTVTSVNN